MARLGDIATYVNGYAFKPSDWSDKGIPIIRIQDLTGNSYQLNRYEGKYDKKYEVGFGDVLISWSASLGVYIWKRGKAVLNQHIFKVVFDKEAVDKDFFVYQVQNILEKASEKTHGATMKHLTKPVFDSLPFYLPSFDEQKRITSILNKTSDLISLRKQQLDKLDELVKSRFVEMFGDPKSNQMRWKTLPLYRVLETGSNVSYGIVQTGDHVPDGVPVFRPIDIADGRIPQRQQLKCTTVEIANQYSRTQLKGYELLITVRGSVGETFQVTDEFFGCNVGRNIVPLRFNTDLVLYPFMQSLFAQDGIKAILAAMTKGIALQGLNMSEFREVEIILPPIGLQEDFVTFREQTDKSKLTIRQSLDKLEMLKKALMQKYFG